MTTTTLHDALRARDEARTALDKVRSLRARLLDRAADLETRRRDLAARAGAALVSAELGETDSETAAGLQDELARLLAEQSANSQAVGAAEQRVKLAERASTVAEQAAAAALTDAARPAYDRLRHEARETYAAAFRAHAKWQRLAKSAGLPQSGHVYAMLGSEGSPESIPEIARVNGIAWPSLAAAAPVQAMTLDEVEAEIAPPPKTTKRR